MSFSQSSAEAYLNAAIDALEGDGDERRAVLDTLPVPIYLTDADGRVTCWNQACIEFAGRVPQLGQDKWCVTWVLHTLADEELPHDRCPMAIAIKEQRPVRGEVAIAMRPDGSRKAFTPYPTPLFGEDGKLVGAINMLIDVSKEQAPALAEQAARCRRLAGAVTDRFTADLLRGMARGYEINSASLQSADSGLGDNASEPITSFAPLCS